MMSVIILIRVLLLPALLPSDVMGEKDSVFLYGRLGSDILLPCTRVLSPNCSSISWTYFRAGHLKEIVKGGQMKPDTAESKRASIMSNCSITIWSLTAEDSGSYVCLEEQVGVTDIYLSVLAIASASPISQLRPGGTLNLTCVLFTYYDAGSCKAYSSVFKLQWLDEDGRQLPRDSRKYNVTEASRCDLTLVTMLEMEDDDRLWRCQLNSTENSSAVVLAFRSSFLFKDSQTHLNLERQGSVECPVELPISRIMLCVALPLMVGIVALFTWQSDRKKEKAAAAVIEL